MTLFRRGLAAALAFGVSLAPVACVPVAMAADTTLTPTALTQIEVGASEDTWGEKLNANTATINGWFDSGPALKVANGGTGATTAAGARTALGLPLGTSGATVPLLNGANIWSSQQAFNAPVNITAGQTIFPATQNPSSGATTLDDYKEGTFNATLTANTPPIGVTYLNRTFTYVKIGRLVTVSGRLTVSGLGSGGGSNVQITGLPYAGSTGGDSVSIGYGIGFSLASGGNIGGYIIGSVIQLVDFTNTGAASLQWSSLSDNFDVMVSASYIASN
jgi:hypothetical protein